MSVPRVSNRRALNKRELNRRGLNTLCRYGFVAAVMSLNVACTTTAYLTGVDKKADIDLFMVSVNAQRAYQQSRWLDAVRLYQEIIEHVPADAVAWFRLANTYAQQGAFDRAIHAYEQSITHDSEQPKAWFNLSTAYLLNAQSAMQRSHTGMRKDDPARAMIDNRLHMLSNLIHGRVEQADVGFTAIR